MKRNTRKITIRVTPQTLYHLEQLAAWNGYREIGHVVDKLMREKMIELRVIAKPEGSRNGKQTG